jgi:hypothetical protein
VEPQDQPGVFLYTPDSEFHGTDQFTYRIADSEGLESGTAVIIMVKPVNDPPVIEDQNITLNRNANRTVYFSGEDPEGEKVTFNVVDGPEHGQLWVYPQVATYYPQKGYAGPDQFTYRASDGVHQSELATVSIEVLDRNNPPSAQDQSLATKPGQPLEITLIGSDLDPNRLGFLIVDPPQEGRLEGSGAQYIYYPREYFLGIDRFTYQAWDRRDTSELAQVEINVTDRNTAPVAEDLSAETSVNTAVDIELQGEDAEADPLDYQIITPPQHGQVTGTGPTVHYEPNPDFTGADRFGYRVNDGELDSQEATVTITVLAANRPPKTGEQKITVSRNSSITLDLNVSDPNEDTLRSVIFEGPRHGLLAGRFTRYTYTPAPSYVGSDQFPYNSWDGHAYSDKGRVSITVTPYQPNSSEFGFSAIRAQPNGTVDLTLESGAKGNLEVQVSTNLVDWYLLETVNAHEGTITVTDTNALRSDQRFYRARTRDD